MSKRNGWKRLGIVLGVPYFTTWAFVGIDSYLHTGIHQRRFLTAIRENDADMLEAAYYAKLNNEENIGLALLFGIVVPAISLVVFLVVRWVYRGFKSDGETRSP